MIPIYEEPYLDEHILGWLFRLAKMNGWKMEVFLKTFLPKFKWEHSADTVGNLSGIGFADPLKLLRQNTIYYALFPVLPEGMQAKLIWRFLYGGDIHWYHTVTGLRLCPECIKEDTKAGRLPYYRVWHQLDDVHTCAVHKSPLWEIPTKNIGCLEDVLEYARPVEGKGQDFADLVYRLYREPIYTSLERWGYGISDLSVSQDSRQDLFQAITKELPPSVPGYQYLEMFWCGKCGKQYAAHPFSARTLGVCRDCMEQLSRQELIDLKAGAGKYMLKGNRLEHKCGRVLSGGFHAFLWSDRVCPCTTYPTLEDYQKEFDDHEFSIESFYRKKGGKTVFQVKHEACGNSFEIGRTDFLKNRYCRVCDSFPERFRKKFEAMAGNEYRLLELPESSDKPFQAVHETCGTKFQMRARNFLEGQRCPFCQKNIGFEKTKELLEENADLTGYVLEDKSPDMGITMPDGTTKIIRLAWALQDLTRLDEPEFFVRKHRIEPIYGDKSMVYRYLREHCNADGIFVSDKDYRNMDGMTSGSFFSSINYLINSGHITRLSKGVYKVVEKTSAEDSQ